jgi:hypothetical protein
MNELEQVRELLKDQPDAGWRTVVKSLGVGQGAARRLLTLARANAEIETATVGVELGECWLKLSDYYHSGASR